MKNTINTLMAYIADNATNKVTKVSSRFGYTAWAIDGLVDEIGYIFTSGIDKDFENFSALYVTAAMDSRVELADNFDHRTARAVLNSF